MRAPVNAPQRPIAVGSIVAYEGYQWLVVERHEEPGLPGKGPGVTLKLEREEQVKASTPYGRPQRYKMAKKTARISERRVLLVAEQTTLF